MAKERTNKMSNLGGREGYEVTKQVPVDFVERVRQLQIHVAGSETVRMALADNGPEFNPETALGEAQPDYTELKKAA